MTILTKLRIAIGGLIMLSACQTIEDDVIITAIAVEDLPANILATIKETRPEFTPEEIEKKVRQGRTYYDIEGTASGDEIEFDILITETGPSIVEIQRDLDWTDVPEIVRETYARETNAEEPVRTIESVQTDGSVIYELFLAGAPSDPSYEIRTKDDAPPELLSERWEH